MLLPRVEDVGFSCPNDLGDPGQAAECRRVQDTVPISLELLALVLLYGPVATPEPVGISPHAWRAKAKLRHAAAADAAWPQDPGRLCPKQFG